MTYLGWRSGNCTSWLGSVSSRCMALGRVFSDDWKWADSSETAVLVIMLHVGTMVRPELSTQADQKTVS